MKSEKRFLISIWVLYLTLLFFIPSSISGDLDCENVCAPTDPNCKISIDETISDQNISALYKTDYLNYSVTSPYMNITIIMTPDPLVDYDLYTDWTGACPTNTCDQTGPGEDETCSQDLPAGTYILGVNRTSSYAYGNYSLTLTGEDYCNQCQPDPNCNISCGEVLKDLSISQTGDWHYLFYTLDSPKHVEINLGVIGGFIDYDLYTDWAGTCPTNPCDQTGPGENETCSQDLPAGTYILGVNRTSFSAGNYELNLTCKDIPIYNFETWAEGPSLFTIGKPESVSIYVRNLGYDEDSYNITPIASSHLIDVSIPSNRIVSLERGRVRNTIGTITLLGNIEGNVIFNVTSEANSSLYQLTAPINIRVGFPINLPEFKTEGLLQILILASLLLFIFSYHET